MIPSIGQEGPINFYEDETGVAEGEGVPSLTYRFDLERKTIKGFVDGIEAVQQAAFKLLQTYRYDHLIYSHDYGTEWELVLGQDRLLARSEIRRVLTEALLQDDRITEVAEMEIREEEDRLTAEFTIFTPYGDFRMEKEWTGDGGRQNV